MTPCFTHPPPTHTFNNIPPRLMNHPHPSPLPGLLLELLKWALAALIVYGAFVLAAMFAYGRLWAILPALSLCYIGRAAYRLGWMPTLFYTIEE